MVLRNHIAYRFLFDEEFMWDMIESTHPHEWSELTKKKLCQADEEMMKSKIASYYDLIRPEHNKTYYITNSVLQNLELLKLEVKDNGHYDWSVFQRIPLITKYTFIFPDNHLLRMKVYENSIVFCDLKFKLENKKTGEGQSNWENFYVDRETGALCDHFDSPVMKGIEEFVYKFLCFMFLTENDEVVLNPGQSHGTKRTGKIINELKIPMTVVNSRWNTTVIRNEGFMVSGHFRLQPWGPGMLQRKLIFIEPFEKTGYTRQAKSTL